MSAEEDQAGAPDAAGAAPAAPMSVERDLAVVTRDGTVLRADVFRPEGQAGLPVILSISPYGKDISWLDRYPDHGFELSPLAVWETPDPAWWVPKGYALARLDPRGIGNSEGMLDPLSALDTADHYDAIEWLASQPWCNGKVGLLGVSFYAIVQWKVAALAPPHLAAIVPWEGANDLYRDWTHQGGIYADGFIDFWWQHHFIEQPVLGAPPAVNWRDELPLRPLDDEWYRERSAELERIELPLLSVGNWGAFHLHLRGNVEGFARARSPERRLVMLTGSHLDPFYTEWGKAEQLRFLDHFLRGEDNGVKDEAPVRLAVRHGNEIEWRDEWEWPLARTQWTKRYLDAGDCSLRGEPPVAQAETSYPSPQGAAAFDAEPVSEPTELTGPVCLRVWVSSSTEDADLFVSLRQIGADGTEIFGIGPRGGPVPMALGWLRASHRRLDPKRSLPYRPWHTHDDPEPLVPGEPTALDVEIWPTSMVLAPGQHLRLELRANDEHMAPLTHGHPADRPPERIAGTVRVHTGPGHDGWLLLPVIPADPSRPPSGVRLRAAPTRAPAAAGATGRVHTLVSEGLWTTELEGYGQISRYPDREEAIAAGCERARRSRVVHVVHHADGSVDEVHDHGAELG